MSTLKTLLDGLLHNPLLWVVVAAAILGWLDHRGHVRRMHGYDAWWQTHLRQPLRDLLRGSLRR